MAGNVGPDAGGSDTWATAIMAAAIEKTGPYDAIFCGRQAIDGDSQSRAEIAEFQNSADYICKRNKDGPRGFEVISTETAVIGWSRPSPPVLFTAIKELNQPRT